MITMKKVLIWIGCFLGSFIVNLLLLPLGLGLGYGLLYVINIFLPRYLCKKLDIKTVEKEAYSKGLSIRQYVASVVPSSLMDFCEAHKGEKKLIKENIERFNAAQDAETKIPKRILVVLFEMYK